MTFTQWMCGVAAAFALVACGEKPQALSAGSASKQDAAAFNGTGSAAFMAQGWKPGDKASWEQQLKARMQNGQNDYSKAN
jgi:hypothetical protein